jgi:NhaP-type Na+/H+ or K+/H+ antiporter
MIEVLVVGVLGLLAIAATTAFADRIGLAAPLLLVAFGIVVSLAPGVPTVVVDPEWILVGVLPPLLYASAVAMPAMDFRREFAAISGLSVLEGESLLNDTTALVVLRTGVAATAAAVSFGAVAVDFACRWSWRWWSGSSSARRR